MFWAQMTQLPQTRFFFSKKTINIVFMYEDTSFLGQKVTQLPQTSLKSLCNCHVLPGPFHCEKFKNNSYGGSRIITMDHFRAQSSPFAPPQTFLDKDH